MAAVRDCPAYESFGQPVGRICDYADSVHFDRLGQVVPDHSAAGAPSIIHNVSAEHDMTRLGQNVQDSPTAATRVRDASGRRDRRAYGWR
jgi:hypothetical protein